MIRRKKQSGRRVTTITNNQEQSNAVNQVISPDGAMDYKGIMGSYLYDILS